MIRILTAEQMKYLDNRTITYHKIPSMVLMERASLAVVKHMKEFDLSRTLVVCGSGNNGGDGFAVARLLHLYGINVELFFVGNYDKMSEECRCQMDIALSYGVRCINNPVLSEYTTIVDAIFGVGLCREITEKYRDIILAINDAKASVIAVDIPSGVSADDGGVLGCAVKAEMTVTFAYGKVGHMLYPGKEYCGKLIIEDIGIYQKEDTFESDYYMFEEQDLNLIPLRKKNSNKGTFGKVLLIAGCESMPGASVLSGQAVMRTGAGMVRIVTPVNNRHILATSIPEAILNVYESADEAINLIREGMLWADVVVMGPGLGITDRSRRIVSFVLEYCKIPLVLDADALNIISEDVDVLRNISCSCIITPHVGEMSRLSGCSIYEVSNHLLKMAKEFASEYQVQCVLKDAATCIAMPDGVVYVNGTGNSGMATAGSGDVLTGLIGGLLAVGVDYKYAGALGAYLHGRLGEVACKCCGTAYMMAGDLIKALSCFRLGEEKNYEGL